MRGSTIKENAPLSASKWIFACCMIAYACAYIARGNFSFARSLMIENGVISAGTAGVISAVYFICYAVGQLVNGIIADRRSPFVMVIIGLFLVVFANIMMCFVSGVTVFAVIFWGINGVGQSMLWSPVFYIISCVIDVKIKFIAVTAISLTTPVGKISCSALCGTVLISEKWQSVFYMASLVICVVLIVWIAMFVSVKKYIVNGSSEKKTVSCKNLENDSNISKKALLQKSGILVMLPALAVHGLFLNGIVELIPSILTTEYQLSASGAAVLEGVIPLVGVFGVFFSNFVYFKMFAKNEMKSAFFVMSATLLPMLVILLLSFFSNGRFLFSRISDAVIFVMAYGVIYILQLAFGHLVISLVPMKMSKFGIAATLTGLNNAVNYGGSAIATYGMSYAVAELPLTKTVFIWFICFAGAIVSLLIAQKKWSIFIKDIKW